MSGAFDSASKIAEVLRESQILRSAKLPDDSKAASRVTTMREQLATDPREITKGQSFSLLRRAIGTLSEQLDKRVKEVWKEYVDTTAPPVDSKQLKHHRDSPRLADAVYQIGRHLDAANRLAKTPPSSTESLQGIMENWEAIRVLMRQLPVTDEPEVQAFLDAAISKDGSSLELLTETVKEWLQQNGMASDFCIRQQR